MGAIRTARLQAKLLAINIYITSIVQQFTVGLIHILIKKHGEKK
jgi:hypothetical protein